VEALHSAIRHIPKPVIAMVNGFAVGGGHVLHVLCDLSIAADSAVFGQTGPRVGSVDAGHGTGFLARVVGEKKAREIWYLCRQYSAQDALAMGLVNKVVPLKDLRAEVEQWCSELLDKSPTALALAKQSFNIDSEPRAGVAQFAHTALGLYYRTDEAMEGRNASVENPSAVRAAVLVGDGLLRIFEEGKDGAEQADPPEISLGTAFDAQQPPSQLSDYR